MSSPQEPPLTGTERLEELVRQSDACDPWEVASVLAAVPEDWMKIAGEWHQMERHCQYRQRAEKTRIQYSQPGDCWMDGRYLWREVPDAV